MSQSPPKPSSRLIVPKSLFEKASSIQEFIPRHVADIARHLLSVVAPLTSSSVVHDNASGSGVVTGEILRLSQTHTPKPVCKIHATDITLGMIEALGNRAEREHWPAESVSGRVLDSVDLSVFKDATFSHTFMAQAIFMLPDPGAL